MMMGPKRPYNPKTSALEMKLQGADAAFDRTFKAAEKGRVIRLI